MARYICDFCKVAEFLDYDEACRHEEICEKRAKPTEPPPEFEPPRNVRAGRPASWYLPPPPPHSEQSVESEGESLDTKKPPASVAEAAAAVVAEVVAEAEAAAAAAPAAASLSKPLPRHNLFAPSTPREDPAPQAMPPAAPMPKDSSAQNPRKTREPRRKPTKCHHCRNITNQFRRCSYWNVNGRQCRLGYCQRCLEDIYDHVAKHGPWDQCLSDKEWHCPSCQDSCQCQPCAIRRKKEEKRMSTMGDRERRSRRGSY